MTTITAVERRTVRWRGLVGLAVCGDLALLLAQGVARRDLEALVVAAVMLLGAGLLRRGGGFAGLVLLCLSFANLVVWMLPAAVSNAAHRAGLDGILLPAVLAAISLAGLVAGLAAAVAAARGRAGGQVDATGEDRPAGLAGSPLGTHVSPGQGGSPEFTVSHASGARRGYPQGGSRVPLWAAVGAVATVAAVLGVAALVGPGAGGTAAAGELRVDISGAAFQPVELTASAGEVTVSLVNRDLFWHSFTIDDPAVNADVPVGGARRLTFTAPPGTYEFYCRVPGHRQAGMVGTLTVG